MYQSHIVIRRSQVIHEIQILAGFFLFIDIISPQVLHFSQNFMCFVQKWIHL